jgi:hypothetical protein
MCTLNGTETARYPNSKVSRENVGMYVLTVFCILVYNKNDVSLFSDAASKYVTSVNFFR